MRLAASKPLCNFGNGTADAEPLGGPATRLREDRVRGGGGALPWHVPATLINSTHAVCISPHVDNATNSSFLTAPVELSLNGQLRDRTASGKVSSLTQGELLYSLD